MRMSVMDLKMIQKKNNKKFCQDKSSNLHTPVFGRLKSYPCKSCPYKMKKHFTGKIESIAKYQNFLLLLFKTYMYVCSILLYGNENQ